jgi:hypothetical protein
MQRVILAGSRVGLDIGRENIYKPLILTFRLENVLNSVQMFLYSRQLNPYSLHPHPRLHHLRLLSRVLDLQLRRHPLNLLPRILDLQLRWHPSSLLPFLLLRILYLWILDLQPRRRPLNLLPLLTRPASSLRVNGGRYGTFTLHWRL